MEIQPSVGSGRVEDTQKPKCRIQDVARVSADRRQASVEVDGDAEHPRRGVGNKVGDILRRRDTGIDPPETRIRPTVHVEHHRAAVDYASALSEHRPLEVAGAADEGCVAEPKPVDCDDGSLERYRIDKGHQVS